MHDSCVDFSKVAPRMFLTSCILTAKVKGIPADITRCEEPNTWGFTLGALLRLLSLKHLSHTHSQMMDPTARTTLYFALACDSRYSAC